MDTAADHSPCFARLCHPQRRRSQHDGQERAQIKEHVTAPESPAADDTDAFCLVSLLKEKIVLDHGLELYRNLQQHESDCFRKVTLMLSDGCGSLANLDSIQSMTYAILLTLCELSTAAVPIPHACRAVQSQSAHVSPETITHCALTLSKTPQTWTSYSGYHRDVGK
ncbi:unnamed protein product [Mucor fragilis]